MPTVSALLTTLLFAAAPAGVAATDVAATDADADELARVGESRTYHFEGDDLEGRVLTAEGTRVGTRRGIDHASLINLRRGFLDRLHAQSNDI